MTDDEKIQTLGRVMLAANEYIRQLESELDGPAAYNPATRTMMAQTKWQQLLPQGQEVFS